MVHAFDQAKRNLAGVLYPAYAQQVTNSSEFVHRRVRLQGVLALLMDARLPV